MAPISDLSNLAGRIRGFVRGHEIFLLPLALVIGCAGGVLVSAMSWAAQLAHVVIYGIPIDVRLSAHSAVSPVAAIAAPVAGGLLLAAMEWSRRRWKLSNAADPVEANALRGGHLSLRDSFVVSCQTLISNGSGASVGLEAGYTQIGAGVASWIGRAFKLRRNDMRTMVGCGAAAAIAAAFNAPLTGVFYACELVVGSYSVSNAAPFLIAALSGALVSGQFGQHPYSFDLVAAGTGDFGQSTGLAVLGLICGVAGIGVMYAAAYAERLFNQKWIPFWLKPALGGVCVGAMAIYTPQVLAAGHGAMALDLDARMTMLTIATIAGLKILACVISLASGFRGGLFFASLFVGCLIGKFYQLALASFGFGISLDPITSALTGMATLGVAIVGGPLTMAFLVLEMTRNFELTAAVLLACIVSSVLVRSTFGHSFSTWRLHLRGETIRGADDIGWHRGLTVKSMMRTDVPTMPATATIAVCRLEFRLGSHQAIFVSNASGKYVGTAMLSDIFAGDIDAAAGHQTVGTLMHNSETVLLPDMNIKDALHAFEQAEADVLPVLKAYTNREIIGFLSESYAYRRYIQESELAAGHRTPRAV